jgi:Icc-related predicted phosphoesterase
VSAVQRAKGVDGRVKGSGIADSVQVSLNVQMEYLARTIRICNSIYDVKVVITSDCHGGLDPYKLPQGDLLIIAGDLLPNRYADPEKDAAYQLEPLLQFDAVCAKLPFNRILMIAGNHDWVFVRNKGARKALKNITYLEDEQIELDGIKFYGSPHQPEFFDWAFNLPRKGPELLKYWNQIPQDTDVLITHGPPYGILDRPFGRGEPAGCELLLERVKQIKPRLHVFGHIHGGYGKIRIEGTLFVNASLCDEAYRPVNPPHVVDLGRRSGDPVAAR